MQVLQHCLIKDWVYAHVLTPYGVCVSDFPMDSSFVRQMPTVHFCAVMRLAGVNNDVAGRGGGKYLLTE